MTVMALSVVLLMLARLPEPYFSMSFTLAALLGLAMAVQHIDRMWIIILAVLPFLGLASPLFGEPKMTGIRLLLIGITGLLFAKEGSIGSQELRSRHAATITFLCFVAANVVSGLNTGQIESVFRALTYLEPFLFCVLTYNVVRRDPDNLRQILRGISIGGGAVAALGGFELVTQRHILSLLDITMQEDAAAYLALNRFGMGGRVMSVIGQPVYAGIYLTLWLIVAVAYNAQYRPGERGLLLLLVPLGLLVILSTGSRGPILALLLALLAFVLFNRQSSGASVVVAVMVATAGLLLYQLLPDVFSYFRSSFVFDQYSTESANVVGRLQLTDVFLDIFRQNPLLGNGPGLIQKGGLQGAWRYEGLAGLENQYATILADGGILAGSTYLLYMGAVFSSLLHVRRHRLAEIGNMGVMALILFVFYFTVVGSVTCLNQVSNLLLMAIYGAVLGINDASGAPIHVSPRQDGTSLPRLSTTTERPTP